MGTKSEGGNETTEAIYDIQISAEFQDRLESGHSIQLDPFDYFGGWPRPKTSADLLDRLKAQLRDTVLRSRSEQRSQRLIGG